MEQLFWGIIVLTAVAHGGASEEMLPDVKRCLGIDGIEQMECLEQICVPNRECAEGISVAATSAGGPEKGIEILSELAKDNRYGINTTGHDIAHMVGRETAKHFGSGGTVFMRCPQDFLFGCQHGFFEAVLMKELSGSKTAEAICESAPTWTEKQKFFCYHGAGHGIVMANAYDFKRSLTACDGIASELGKHGCAQGLFMELINAELRGEGKAGIFSKRNLLAPCDTLGKYQWACYGNMAPYLLTREGNFRDAVEVCMNAERPMRGTCIAHFGQMTTDPHWQKIILNREEVPAGSGSFIEVGERLCDHVPESERRHCVGGAIEHLMNYERIPEAIAYCRHLSAETVAYCFQEIGFVLDDNGLATFRKRQTCSQVPAAWRTLCMNAKRQDGLPWKEELVPVHWWNSLFRQTKALLRVVF
ncbi:MAG TPA: hypothetical protein VI873_01425 [Candidatus Peribacteraceae bacterium]|nr:hypothetical protein [Candidatus Peribacteraceae bacterium]